VLKHGPKPPAADNARKRAYKRLRHEPVALDDWDERRLEL